MIINKCRKLLHNLLVELRFSSLDKSKHVAKLIKAFPMSFVSWVETVQFCGLLLVSFPVCCGVCVLW